MNCEYVRQHYDVPACIGRRIIFYGNRPGIIAEDRGNYIGVNFDADKPGVICNVHPTDRVEYGDMGEIRKPTASQKRYRDFIHSEYPGTFAEYLNIRR